MIQGGPAQRGMCSCMLMMLSIIFLCGLVSIFGEQLALPALLVWVVLAGYLVYSMAVSLKQGQAGIETEGSTAIRGNGAGTGDVPSGELSGPQITAFQNWLLQQLINRNMTGMQLALELGIRDDLVEGWVQGRSLPSPVDCAKLASYFGIRERDVLRLAEWSK